jgi:hypothetical protein
MAAEEDEHLQVLDLAAQTIDNASQFVYLTFRQMCKCFLHTEGILCQYSCKMPKKSLKQLFESLQPTALSSQLL